MILTVSNQLLIYEECEIHSLAKCLKSSKRELFEFRIAELRQKKGKNDVMVTKEKYNLIIESFRKKRSKFGFSSLE